MFGAWRKSLVCCLDFPAGMAQFCGVGQHSHMAWKSNIVIFLASLILLLEAMFIIMPFVVPKKSVVTPTWRINDVSPYKWAHPNPAFKPN
jgi:hypothetical protein